MIDVCFLLEGTYPYVSGGVSTWVHQLITSMKDVRFGIVYIAPNSDPTRSLKYELPPHVLYLKEIYLHDYDLTRTRRRRPRKKDYEKIRDFYDDLLKGSYGRFPEFLNLFRGDKSCFDTLQFFSSERIWELLTSFYRRIREDVSFLDFFWTWRGTHLPLLQVFRAEIPRARIYHSVSTGYAGLLGAMAKVLYGEKFFLTEHGIYTHERLLEISQAHWIFEKEKPTFRASRDLSFFKKWWIEIFRVMSALTYAHADRIFTLYEGNKIREILDGARPEKITVIPNGIDLTRFSSLQTEKKSVPQVALIGRVVPIKDVKTFVQAARLVLQEFPEAVFHVLGSTDEEEGYYEECRLLVEALGLEDRVKFTGQVDSKEYYRFVDLVVPTSLSEAQPYVILEAQAAGVPVVATDVGACREMLGGRTPEDRALGLSGLVTGVANPRATAEAVVGLLKDRGLYRRFSEAGRARARRFYDQDDLLSRYLNIYEQNL